MSSSRDHGSCEAAQLRTGCSSWPARLHHLFGKVCFGFCPWLGKMKPRGESYSQGIDFWMPCECLSASTHHTSPKLLTTLYASCISPQSCSSLGFQGIKETRSQTVSFFLCPPLIPKSCPAHNNCLSFSNSRLFLLAWVGPLIAACPHLFGTATSV